MGPSVTSLTSQDYVLGRSDEEHQRLRSQARVWEAETSRLLDRVGLAEGARCLYAGCGPGGPYDLVYARLLLLHVADPGAVLRRLWDAVVPGGHLVVHEYSLAATDVLPSLEVMQEWRRVALGAFTAAGRDLHLGHRLPRLFGHAGIGTPDGTDVAGRLEPMSDGGGMAIAVFNSLLPTAIAFGLTTPEGGSRWVQDFTRATVEHPDHIVLWPLLIGARKRKPDPRAGTSV